MLYDYKEVIAIYGNDYNLKKALLDKRIFKIEKGMYSDGEHNFTTVELVLKKHKNAFLVKESALHLIGFVKDEPDKIHIGTARNALRIRDSRIQQHFYSSVNISEFYEGEWDSYENFLSYENIKKYTTENNNEIRLFNLKALFFDLVRNYKSYKKEELFEILEKFKNCRYFYGVKKWDLEYCLQHEKVVNYLEFLDEDLYEMIEDIFSEMWEKEFEMEYGF